jgi:dTDP-4-amino-4,6-dideoxygalactose transaminase
VKLNINEKPMTKTYKHAWPKISQETIKAVLDQLKSGEISIYNRSGIFEEFENEFASHFGMKHALLTSSGTAAIHSAMVACDFKKGDEVICPAYTFFATVTPIFQTGAAPVLCDAAEDGNIDPDEILKLITPRTKAVVVTHMWGMPCKMPQIKKICRQHGLLLLEDCSHAHGAKIRNKYMGTYGDISAFSLQGQKIITGGEGGVVLTNSRELYERALMFGHYNKRCRDEIKKGSKYFDYALTGFGLKLRAHPLAIAIAKQQFSHIEKWIEIKRKNAKYLTSLLADVEGIILPKHSKEVYPSWYAYLMRFDESCFDVSVDTLCEEMIKAGLADADKPGSTCPLNFLKLFQDPSLLFPEYKGKVNYKSGDFPVAEQFHAQAIKVPIDIFEGNKYRQVLENYARVIKKVTSRHLIK